MHCRECVVEHSTTHARWPCGVTEAERDESVASQVGVRCLCLAAPAEHVDHCRNTGRVRGVLLLTWKESRGSQHS
ncbi:endonuclease domain-containing protein [Streptomyces resistomycificus]|uniref:endonuclease domain-containing protein n=1 Tax=Streptomyces resistomycificus TaxID=67356 RepID=UPI0035BC95D7